MQFIQQSVELLEITNDPLILLEKCGRVCYKSSPKVECPECHSNFTRGCPRCAELAATFVNAHLTGKHESVLEHASATFLITTDRGMTHEIIRHRPGCAYSQESTRFCNYGRKDGHEKGQKALDEAFNLCVNLRSMYEPLQEDIHD